MSQKSTLQQNNRKLFSWKHVFVFLVLFFPLGIYLAVLNLSSEKDKRFRNGLVMVFSGLLLSVMMLYLIYCAMPGGRFHLWVFIDKKGSLALPFFLLVSGIFLMVFGSLIFLKGRRDRLLLSYLTQDRILDLEDLCLLLQTSPAVCFDQIELLMEDQLLKDYLICYSAKKPVLIPKTEKKKVRCVSDYIQDPEYTRQLPPPARQPNYPAFYKKLWNNKVPSLVNSLWVTGAIVSCLGGVFLLPAGLLLSLLAAGMECRKYLRKNPCILHCAVYSFLFICFMTGFVAITMLDSISAKDGGMAIISAYLPNLLLTLFDLAVYFLLTRRARRYYRYMYLIREEKTDSKEDLCLFCGFKEKNLEKANRTLTGYGLLD